MGVDGYDGAVGAFQFLLAEATPDELRDLILGGAFGQLGAGILEGLVDNLSQPGRAAAVALQLLWRPTLGRVLHQVCRGNYLYP